MKRARTLPAVAGFTLIEMILAIVITGVIAGMIGTFLHWPMFAYTSTESRARLLDNVDTALRRMAREVRTALPNSIRVTIDASNTTYLEFIPTVGGGRYRAFPDTNGNGNVLNFSTAQSSFDVLGPVPVYAAGNSVVIYNLGPGSIADAYVGSNRVAVTSANNTMPGAPAAFSTDAAPATVTLAAATLFPLPSPSSQFQIVTTPVTYTCQPGGQLLRYSGYAFATNQPTPPAGTSTILANGVSSCTLIYNAAVQHTRTALVTLGIGLADSNGETVQMVHQMHVMNLP